MKKLKLNFSPRARGFLALAQVCVIAVGVIMPLVLNKAEAAQITARSVTISSGVPSATSVTYTYGFTLPTAGNLQTIKFEACTTAVGTCTGPTGQNINQGSEASRSGWSSAATFSRNATGGGGCTPANNVLCVDRTAAVSESGAKTLGWNTQTNPSTANSTFFIRITTYSDTGWTTSVDTGTVASAVVQTLTVNAAVAEVLNFCVGSSTVNDATTSVGADCAALAGTSLNIGTLDTGSTNVSPVNTNGGDNKNGVAMIRTNAASGAVVSYDSIQQSGTNQLGTLRISGASCNASSAILTDQCIRAIGTTQATLTAGTENFGMTIGAINCGSVSSYTCTFSAGTYNLVRDTAYDGNGTNTYTTDSGAVGGTTNQGYAWDDGGTSRTIASSASSTTKVIDDEAMILKFAATPSITTPFGLYAAQADFIAVPTY
jgi:hypothetical protein